MLTKKVFKENFMKKKNVILCAGILSMAMLGGCGGTTPEENNTVVTNTQEVKDTTETEKPTETEDATETPESTELEDATETPESTETGVDSNAEFSSIMTEIYGVSTDAASAEAVAEKFKNYAFTYGAPSSSTAFETMANDWFQTMEETEGKDIRSEFNGCFETVTSTAQEMDVTLEYDVAYLNVVNGILAAIGE